MKTVFKIAATETVPDQPKKGGTQTMRKKVIAVFLAAAMSCGLCINGMPAVYAAEKEVPAGTTYYFSSTDGDNNNSGTSEKAPWETLEKLKTVHLKPGDQILLENGSVFDGTIHLVDVHGTAEAPIRISNYGSSDAARPIINGNGQGLWHQDYKGSMDNVNHRSKGYVSSTILLYDVDFVEVSNLEITNDSNDFDFYGSNINKTDGRIDRTGVAGMAKNGGTMQHVYLDNLYIHDVAGNLEDKHMNNGGIQMNVTPPDDESTGIARYDDVHITNCYVENVSRAGIVVGYTYKNRAFQGRQLDSEMVKKNGHTNILIEGNYVKDAGNDAICVMYAYQPLVQYNISDGAGKDLDDGYPGYWQSFCAAIWPWKTKEAVFQYNEAFDTVGPGNGDGQAWDVDWSDTTVYQYNYSHGNGGGSMLVCLDEAYNGYFRYNISQNDLKSFVTLQGNPNAHFYNNVFYVDGDLQTAVHHPESGKRSGAAEFKNNIFYNASSQKWLVGDHNAAQTWRPGGGNQVFDTNLYFGYEDVGQGLDTTKDSNKITEDPKLADPGSAPEVLLTNLSTHFEGEGAIDKYFGGYKLQEGSPAINAGVAVYIPDFLYNFQGVGGKDAVKVTDFFGNSVGDQPDIGVFESDTPEDEVNLNVMSGVYSVQEDSIQEIPSATAVETFLQNIRYSSKASVKVLRDGKEITGKEMIHEGDILRVFKTGDEQTRKEYTLHLAPVLYDRTGWKAIAGSAQQSEGPELALDNNKNTLWHSSWNGCTADQAWFAIDMKQEQPVSVLKYIPRSSQKNGLILKYEIYYSTAETPAQGDWIKAAEGTWAEDNTEKTAVFDEVTARHIKLVALESGTQEPPKRFVSAAEIYLGGVPKS